MFVPCRLESSSYAESPVPSSRSLHHGEHRRGFPNVDTATTEYAQTIPRSARTLSANQQGNIVFSQTAPSALAERLEDNLGLEQERFEYQPQQPSAPPSCSPSGPPNVSPAFSDGSRSSNARRRQQQQHRQEGQQQLDPQPPQRQPIIAFLPAAVTEPVGFSNEAHGSIWDKNFAPNSTGGAIDSEAATPVGGQLSGQRNGVAMAGVRDLRAHVLQRDAAAGNTSSGIGAADYSLLGESSLIQPLPADSPRQPLNLRNHRSCDPDSSHGTRKGRSPRQPHHESQGIQANPASESFLPGLGPTARQSDALAQQSDGRKILFAKSRDHGDGARSGDTHGHDGSRKVGSSKQAGNGDSICGSGEDTLGSTGRKGSELAAEAPLSASMERIVELRRRRHEAQANDNNTVTPVHDNRSNSAATATDVGNSNTCSHNKYSNTTTTVTTAPTTTLPVAASSEGLVGLANLGNTCFMNAALQCLLATKPLLAYFAPGSATATAVINQHPPPPAAALGRSSHRSSSRCDPGRAGDGVVAAAFGRLVSEMASQQAYGHVAPRELKAVVARQAPWLAGYQQQDCQEFLRFLLDGLSEDLKQAPRVSAAGTAAAVAAALPSFSSAPELEDPADEPPTSFDGPAVLAAAAAAAAAAANDDESVAKASHPSGDPCVTRPMCTVEDVFGGQLQSKVQCTVCGAASVCFDPFLDLSLPIPNRNAPNSRGRGGGGGGGGSAVSLEACLSEFCSTEELTGVTCSTCNQKQTCLKTLTMHKLPPYLVLHLKRFAFTVRCREKLNAPVRFPVKGLNLAPFVSPPPSPPNEYCGRNSGGYNGNDASSVSAPPHPLPEDSRLSENQSAGAAGATGAAATAPEPVLYDLYGVANHMGALGGGHYTASCLQHAPASSSTATAPPPRAAKNNHHYSGAGGTRNDGTSHISGDDGRWFSYNDTNVTPLNDPLRDLNPEMAYVLFYQRRQP